MEDMSELTAEERARILQHELEAVYGSSSYKIGRAVTWLPRHAKKALAYLAHNGPAISAKYLYTYAKYHKVKRCGDFQKVNVAGDIEVCSVGTYRIGNRFALPHSGSCEICSQLHSHSLQ